MYVCASVPYPASGDGGGGSTAIVPRVRRTAVPGGRKEEGKSRNHAATTAMVAKLSSLFEEGVCVRVYVCVPIPCWYASG